MQPPPSLVSLSSARAQDVTLDELEVASSASGAGDKTGPEVGNKMKNLDAFLDTLPVLSVGQKHVAKFECELNNDQEAATSQVKVLR